MLERLEGANNYLGNVVSRAIGRDAWGKAMRGPGLEMDTYPGDKRPAWAKTVNKVLGHAAPLYSALEVIAPATSRLISPILRATYEETPGKYDHLKAILWIPTMAIDMTLNYAALSGSTLSEIMAWKLAVNAATHAGLDVAGAMADKIKNHNRPSTTTLAV